MNSTRFTYKKNEIYWLNTRQDVHRLVLVSEAWKTLTTRGGLDLGGIGQTDQYIMRINSEKRNR